MPCIYRVLKLSHLKLTALCQIEMWFSPGTLKLGAGTSPLSNHLSGKRCHQDRDQVPTQNPVWTGSHALSNIQEKVYVAKALFKMESIVEAWAKESGWKKSQWWSGKREVGWGWEICRWSHSLTPSTGAAGLASDLIASQVCPLQGNKCVESW